ncbi:hypothetical protein R0J90_19865, partial [Micrococcus sp. SIMBA_144]
RMLVDEVLQRGSEEMIKGLATLEKAEDTIELLYVIKDAEELIGSLPETITLDDQQEVEAAREKVDSIYGMDAEAEIPSIKKL